MQGPEQSSHEKIPTPRPHPFLPGPSTRSRPLEIPVQEDSNKGPVLHFSEIHPGEGGGGYLDYPFDDRPAVPCSHKTSQAKAVKMDPERYPVLLSGYNYARVVERVGALQSN
jgi:hypothetical protein